MAEQFKLPGASWEEVSKIIMGYAKLDKPCALGDISKVTGVSETTVSRNSGFLVAIGVIEPGAKKTPTETGKHLGIALMHEAENEVIEILSGIVSETEFLKNVVGAVRIRKGMDDSSLKSHIAYSAGAKKTAPNTTGAGAIVEILKLSGNLKDEDGKIVVGVSSPVNSAVSPNNTEKGKVVGDISNVPGHPSSDGFRTLPLSPAPPFQISISVEVKCSADDLDALGGRLRKVVDEFQKETEAENAESENLTE